jgi:hypothetical protein
MGSMGVIVNAEGNGAQPKRALTLDVVVPRSEYVRTLEDETEAMRDDVRLRSSLMNLDKSSFIVIALCCH